MTTGLSPVLPVRRGRSAAATSRLASLDGLRALSIVAVILGHLAGTQGFPAPIGRLLRNQYIDPAGFGVRVFFVISGFLITGLLIGEADRNGRISLTQFYLRRTLRIMPAFFAFLGVVTTLVMMGILVVAPGDLWHAATYTMNYAPNRGHNLGHIWSLSVEEQFYLLWPAVVYWASRGHTKRTAVAVVCLVPLVRIVEAMLWNDWLPMIGTTFETTADCLAIGCVLALYRDELMTYGWYRRAIGSPWIPLVVILAGLGFAQRFRPGILIGYSLMNIGIALFIDRYVRWSTGRVGNVLNARPLVYVGTLSYSIYLWQQLFLNRESNAIATMFPLNIVLTASLAWLSYALVETPILARRAVVARWLRVS